MIMVSQISFGHVELNHWIPVSSLDIEDMTCLDTMLLEPLAAWSWPCRAPVAVPYSVFL